MAYGIISRILHLLRGMGWLAKSGMVSLMCWMNTPAKESLSEWQFNQDHIFLCEPISQGLTGNSVKKWVMEDWGLKPCLLEFG